jgi:hypothetical protein
MIEGIHCYNDLQYGLTLSKPVAIIEPNCDSVICLTVFWLSFKLLMVSTPGSRGKRDGGNGICGSSAITEIQAHAVYDLNRGIEKV